MSEHPPKGYSNLKALLLVGLMLFACLGGGFASGFYAGKVSTTTLNTWDGSWLTTPYVNATTGMYSEGSLYLGSTADTRLYRSGTDTVSLGAGDSLIGATWLNSTKVSASDSYINNDIYFQGTNRTDVLAYPEQAASYIIWVDGSTYYAKNGHTGAIDFSGTDAAAVIQVALNAGNYVFLKPGTYTALTNTIINLNSNNNLVGSGQESTVLVHIQLLIDTKTYVSISDLTVSGYTAAPYGRGIVALSSNPLYIERISSLNNNWDGLYARDCYYGRFNGRFNNNGNDGISLENCNGVTIGETECRSNTGNGAYILNSEPFTIRGGWYEDNLGGAQIQIIGGNEGPVLSGVCATVEEAHISGDTIGIIVSGYGASTRLNSTCIRNNHIYSHLNEGIVSFWCNGFDIYDNAFLLDNAAKYILKLRNFVNFRDQNFLKLNIFSGGAGIIDADASYRTENSGTGVNIALHATHAHVTHGLSYTPSAADIGITWTTSLTNCTSWSVTGISGTEFIVTLYDANGAEKGPSGTVTFSWKSIRTP